MTNKKDLIIKQLREEAKGERSKWNKATLDDAENLIYDLDNIDVLTYANCSERLLCGANNWHGYSWGGSFRVYDIDIAKHYSTQSELKKCTRKDGSLRKPNAREEWLDVQARALRQAYLRIKRSLWTLENQKKEHNND